MPAITGAWRIANEKYWADNKGQGSFLYGNRWNSAGHFALYLGLTPSISALEAFVHLAGLNATKHVWVKASLPDDPALYYRPDQYPDGWDSLVPHSSVAFGDAWLDAGKHLGMLIPSVIMPEELNIILNTQHPAMKQVKLEMVRYFAFDERMFGKQK